VRQALEHAARDGLAGELVVSLSGAVGPEGALANLQAMLGARVAYRGLDRCSQVRHLQCVLAETTVSWLATVDDDDLVHPEWLVKMRAASRAAPEANWLRPQIARANGRLRDPAVALDFEACTTRRDDWHLYDYGGTVVRRAALCAAVAAVEAKYAKVLNDSTSDVALTLCLHMMYGPHEVIKQPLYLYGATCDTEYARPY